LSWSQDARVMCRNKFAPSPKNLRGVAEATASKFFGKDSQDWQMGRFLESDSGMFYL